MIYDDKKFIGDVIKAARKKAKLNQAELCEKLNMSDKNLGNIENGKQFPQVNNFLKIIETLNLKLEDFGVKTKNQDNPVKNELYKIILGSTDKKANAYLKAIKTVDEIISAQ